MNFPTPVALLPSQQHMGGSGGGGGGDNGGNDGSGGDHHSNMNDGQLNMLAGLNPYRHMSSDSPHEQQASGSHSHHGGDDRHDSTSHHS
ncbi:hypothetical protein ACLB2K_052154 [Fragaria x ananassa]